MNVIKVKNLTKTYLIKKSLNEFFKEPFKRKYLTAINNISFDIGENEIVGLIGLNGAGKTTLLKIFSSLLTPDKGSVKIFNYDLEKDTNKIKKIISLINSEERSFYWRLTLKQNLEFFANLYNINKKLIKDKVENVLELADLTDKKNSRFDELSTGMKQRLNIARGLLNDPKLILLDEPTRGLDIKHADEIRSIIKKLSKDKTIIITSHNLEEISELCSKIIIMHKGKAVKIGKFKDIKSIFKRIIKNDK